MKCGIYKIILASLCVGSLCFAGEKESPLDTMHGILREAPHASKKMCDNDFDLKPSPPEYDKSDLLFGGCTLTCKISRCFLGRHTCQGYK